MAVRAFPELTEREELIAQEGIREQSKDDLYFLAKHLLGYNKLTENFHKQMCRTIDTPRYRFKLLLYPRGHYKSTLATESYSIQRLLRNPSERILITNVKLDNSRKFLRTISHHFNTNQKFRWAWRNWWINSYATPYHKAQVGDKLDWVVRNTQDELTLLRPGAGREASITTGAIDASMVSQHYGLIVADDLVNRDYVRTQEQVEKSILYFKDLLDLLDPDGDVVIIGTRWSHVDLYSWIMTEFGGRASLQVPDGIVESTVVAESEQANEAEKEWSITIVPTSAENPVFPEQFDANVLNDLLKAKGPYEFGAQYQLNPTPAEYQNFKIDWINWYDIPPEVGKMNICITVDPAVSLRDYADRTAIVVCGYNKSNEMFLLDGINERLTEDELLDTLYGLALKYSREGKFLLPVGFEAIGFQQTYLYNFDRVMRERGKLFAIEPIKRKKQSKEERILRLVPRMKSGFYAPRKMIRIDRREGEYDFIQRMLWELLRFPFAGFDDIADALADQLDLVQAVKLPSEPKPKADKKVVDFVHPSILQDRGKMPRRKISRKHYVPAVRGG